MDDIPFKKIGIYGVGLLGGSLGLALKETSLDVEIIGIGRSDERLKMALDKGVIDSYTCDPGGISPLLDALVVCTPVRLAPKALISTLPSLTDDAVITDVGSTKNMLVHGCEAAAGERFFVGSHPMAGSHKTGVCAARADLFKNKICVVTETDNSNAPSVDAIVNLWKLIGMRVIRMSPTDHDRLTAHSSHLPHIIAAAMCHAALTQGKDIEPVLGDGFRDSTRIAQGDPSIWVDICLENREAILDSLQSLQSVLSNFYNAIDASDETAIRDFLTEARNWKKQTNSPLPPKEV